MSWSLSSSSKVLIIRLSSIGDIVLCSPIIRCLKNQTGCEIHFLQKEKFKEVQIANPHITRHYYLESDNIRKSLNNENYDLVIDLHKNLRTARIKKWIATRSVTYYKANIKKFLLVNFKVDRLPKEHLVDRYFKAVKQLGVKNDGLGLDFYIDDSVSTEYIDEAYVALVIGAAHYTKQIPTNLCKELIKLSTTKIVLLGGEAEIEKSKQLENCNNELVNYVGKLTLHESAQIIKNASLVITGDTGLMHISAALKKPIVCVWGSTVPAFGMYPYYGNSGNKEVRIEAKELSCRPCTKIGRAKCPKGHFNCMRALSANDIILKTNELLLRN